MFCIAGKVPFIKLGPLIVSEFEPIIAIVNAKVGLSVKYCHCVAVVKLLFPLIFQLFVFCCILCYFILFNADVQYREHCYTNSFCDCDCV